MNQIFANMMFILLAILTGVIDFVPSTTYAMQFIMLPFSLIIRKIDKRV